MMRAIPVATALAATVVAAVVCAGCRSAPASADSKPVKVIWRQVASFSGRGSSQTQSFSVESGAIRVRWRTSNESPKGAGDFKMTLNSAVSGRVLQPLADSNGTGQDTAYVSIDPHWSYLVIDSKNVDWSAVVEEPVTVSPGER
ncbi:MAG: hypothetical protein ACRD30_03450 [Bryobacteraceae bacterium]